MGPPFQVSRVQPRMQVWKETDQNILAVLNDIDVAHQAAQAVPGGPQVFQAAYPAVLNNVIGRNGARAEGDYNQWRTCSPYLGSLAVWTLCGQTYSPGNPHVESTPHGGGGNLNAGIALTGAQKLQISLAVREMFAWPEAQVGHQNYVHKMVVSLNGHAYVFSASWNPTAAGDDITINMRDYQIALVQPIVNMAAVVAAFGNLGL